MNNIGNIVLLCICLPALQTCAATFSITRISRMPDGVSLSWDNGTGLCIVAQSTSLTTGQFQYVGNVLSTNEALLSDTLDSCFYQIRKVRAVQFPDTNLNDLIRQVIPLKYSPVNQIYDIELQTITILDGSSSSITNASGVETLSGLQVLVLDANRLINLNVSVCADLHALDCSYNQLTNLVVSGCTKLQSLDCSHNRLANMDVSACTNLHDFECCDNQLADLNVSASVNLHDLYCWGNDLTHLDISACTNLRSLYCIDNQLANLDIAACTSLQCLWCSRNKLTNLNVSTCTKLQLLECSNNQLNNLDVSACTNLIYLYCNNCNLQSLNISANMGLRYIDVTGNPLANIVVWWTPPSIDNRPSTLNLRYDGNPTFSNPL